MKKTYSKPKLYAESFELAEHIASCSVQQGVTAVSYRDASSCSYAEGGLALFNVGVTGCPDSYDPESFDSLDEYLDIMTDRSKCYNAFSNGNFFAS